MWPFAHKSGRVGFVKANVFQVGPWTQHTTNFKQCFFKKYSLTHRTHSNQNVSVVASFSVWHLDLFDWLNKPPFYLDKKREDMNMIKHPQFIRRWTCSPFGCKTRVALLLRVHPEWGRSTQKIQVMEWMGFGEHFFPNLTRTQRTYLLMIPILFFREEFSTFQKGRCRELQAHIRFHNHLNQWLFTHEKLGPLIQSTAHVYCRFIIYNLNTIGHCDRVMTCTSYLGWWAASCRKKSRHKNALKTVSKHIFCAKTWPFCQ